MCSGFSEMGYCGEDMGGTEVIMKSEVNGRNTRLQCTGSRTPIPLFTLEPFKSTLTLKFC